MVFRLNDDEVGFPDPHLGEEDGFFAVGGKLTPEWLLTAYSNGIFPWFGFRENPDICWYCPMQRFVIFPDEIHISHSMKQLLKKAKYTVSLNNDFEGVIRNCGQVDGRYEHEGAWLGKDMTEAYTTLHRMGYATSVEVWDGDALVGGLYGVTIGRNFIGESMFSIIPNGSKIALIYLASVVSQVGGFIDCQLKTPHLESMGGRYISYEEYMERLLD